MSNLERIIINTLAWFDVSDYPLTLWECWYYLWDEQFLLFQPVSLNDIRQSLQNLQRQGLVKTERGFWYLSDRVDDLVSGRLRRSRWAVGKYKKAVKGARLINRCPFVIMVGLVNTMAWDAPARESDIDLFIITKPGHLFTARGLVSLATQLLGWRRHAWHITNRLCLSFYATTEVLDLRPLAYPDDPYLRFWVASLRWLGGAADAYYSFRQANAWLEKELPNYWRVNLNQLSLPINPWFNQTTRRREKINQPRSTSVMVGSLEKIMRRWQLSYMLKFGRGRFSRHGDGSSAVVINQQMLKFHESDARPRLAALYRRRLAEINNHVIVPEVDNKTGG